MKAQVQHEYLNQTTANVNYFGLASLLKFRVLQMLQYDRVLFLDAGVLPLCNLDYWFYESYPDNGLLGKHVVRAGRQRATRHGFHVSGHVREWRV